MMISIGLWSELPWPYGDDAFWSAVPVYISAPENALRIATFVLTTLLPFGIDTPRQRRGLLIYLLGLGLYAGSYGAQILFPATAWSRSVVGFLAPAWTPFLWLAGIGLMAGDRFFLRWFRGPQFIVVATTFVAFHTAHAAIIFVRSH